MKIRWEVDDGYVCGSRPHYVNIPDDELDECETEEDRNALIDEYVQYEFETKVSYSWKIEGAK